MVLINFVLTRWSESSQIKILFNYDIDQLKTNTIKLPKLTVNELKVVQVVEQSYEQFNTSKQDLCAL